MRFYNFIIQKFVLKFGDSLLGGKYIKNLKLWEKYDKFSEENLKTIQEENLEIILKYTIKNVPFYKNYIYNESLTPVENLKHFPLLTKELLRSERENLVSKLYDVSTLQKNFSSGSSGIQSYSYSDSKYKFALQGIQNHWYKWTGYNIGDKILQFGMSPNRIFPKNFKDFFFRVYYQNAFSLSDNDYQKIYSDNLDRKTEFIIGYPSAINEFSKYLNEKNLSIPIKGVISLGDKLFPHFEINFAKSFQNPKIIDTYGCAEGIMIACREDLPYYYIMSPHVLVEIVDAEGKEVEDGELGYVLVTSFSNFAQPFLRYKLGDLAIKLPKDKYPTNKKYDYPLLEKIVGRETDIVKTTNGKNLIVHSFTGILEYFPQIKQFRIVQDKIEKITIEFITDDYFTLQEIDLIEIKRKIDKLTDNCLEIDFVKVSTIPSTPSGKPQIIKSIFKL